MKKIIFIVILGLGFIPFVSFSQEKDKQAEANDLILSNSFFKAIPILTDLIKNDNNSNLNYKLGLCYFKTNQKIKSIPYFEESIKSVTKKYKLTDSRQTSAPLETFYYFANAQHYNGNLILAFEYYSKYYSHSNKKNNPFRQLAFVGMSQCEVADELINHPQEYVIENLGDTINSSLSEYRPVISLDGSEIFFTSNRLRPDYSNKGIFNPKTGSYFEDIYVSYRTQNGVWTNPNYLEFCKSTHNDASVSLSLNGEMIFVYQGSTGNGDIYYSKLNELKYDKIKPFPAKSLNTSSNETHASMSVDGEFIYFVSDRKGGYGGKDIYRIRKLPDGTWSKAMNLGPTINSQNDEESPFIGADGKTLYFSSNGIKSMGGYDIFVSQMNSVGEWQQPKNMGYPLNSFGDDLYYSTMANGFMGIYASNNKNSKGFFDIYFVQSKTSYYKNVTIFKGYIKTSDQKILPKGITITVKDLTENSIAKIFKPRLRDGGYILNLKPCHSYQITYKYTGKTFYETSTLVPCNSSYQEIHEEIILDVVNLRVLDKKTSEMPR
jgi:tetratricopeptide (TPR) repeat protein